MVRARDTRIDRDMQHRLDQVFLGRTGARRCPHVHGDFLMVAERLEQRERYDRTLAQREARPGPDRAPGAFGDETLKIDVEVGLVRFGPVDMRVAEDLPAYPHSGIM